MFIVSLFLLLAQRRSGACVVEVFLNNGIVIDKGFFISINIVINIEGK